MARRIAIVLTLMMTLAACGSSTVTTEFTEISGPGDTGAPDSTEPPVSTTTTAPPDTTTAPEPTTTTTPPSITGAGSTTTTVTDDPGLTERLWSVVLVTVDDVLNVRSAPGAGSPKVGELSPTETGITATGQQAMVSGSRWIEISRGGLSGWVNSFFLTREWTTEEVDLLWDLTDPLDQLAADMQNSADLSGATSSRGLFVVYLDETLRRWRSSELATVMTDPTVLEWSGTGCHKDEPGGCLSATFAQAVADDFLQAYLDPDVELGLDDVLLGAGSFLPESVIPVPFANFHMVAVHDPGDDPSFSGMDWTTWFVFFDYEEGAPRVVGMSPQYWAP